ADVAVRVGEVAEMDGAGDAGGGAGRRHLGIDAGRQAARLRLVDPVDAEGAFLRHALPLRVPDMALLQRLLAVVPVVVVHDGAGLIGAGDGAVGAADADVVVHGDEAVGALPRRPGRTDRHARRLGA